MNQAEVIDKIRKLLRLGKSPNLHEAELAVQRAFELASKHQIDIESVSLDEESRRIVAEKFPTGARLSFARKKILNLLVSFFNVNIVYNTVSPLARQMLGMKQSLTFIGKPVDIEIARYVYDYLHTCCARALREFCGKHRKRPARSSQESFIQGWVYGVAHKLGQAKGALSNQQAGIVLSEEGRRKQFEEGLYDQSKLKPVKADASRCNNRATWAGAREGNKVEIRKPVATNAAGQQLLA